MSSTSLAHSLALIVAGTDWSDDAAPGREWWRLMTTMLVARTMNVPVFVLDGTTPDGTGARDALVGWLVARLSSPIDDGPFPPQRPIRPGAAVVGTEAAGENIADKSRDSVATLR